MNLPTVPKTTSPLTKGIRTLEGIIVGAANVALVVIPLATPALPAPLAAKLAVGLDAVYAVSRAVVKALAPPASSAPVPPAIRRSSRRKEEAA